MQRVVSDPHAMLPAQAAGARLPELVAERCAPRARALLRELAAGRSPPAQELRLAAGRGAAGAVHAGGIRAEDRMLIVGARTPALLERILDELLSVDTPGAGETPAAAPGAAPAPLPEARLLEEFTRLNRQLERLQRELARKNVELRRREAEITRLMLSDPLTGIANRRHFEKSFAHELERCRRYGTRLCLALADIDHFKRINDELGHNAGDEVLCAVARILQQELRSTDFVARWGGEEFALLLPETGLRAAAHLLERLRRGVGRAPLPPATQAVTVSIGVTGVRSGDTAQSAVARADGALYESKRGGRNRVTVAA